MSLFDSIRRGYLRLVTTHLVDLRTILTVRIWPVREKILRRATTATYAICFGRAWIATSVALKAVKEAPQLRQLSDVQSGDIE